jgi:5'-3' exonuclease
MLYDPASIQSEYGLDHRNYLLYRILTGDKSDAIPGIPGLGLKTLLKEYPLDRHLELSEFLALTLTKAADKSPKKIIASILENIDTIELNFKLMQLSDVDISLHSKNQIRDCIDAEIPRLDKFKILKMIHTDKINSENWNVDSWISNTFSTLNYWK